MKLLTLHAKEFMFKSVEKALEISDEPMASEKYENVLVAFITVEEEDEKDVEGVVAQAVNEIVDIYKKVGAKGIVVYPYAHLSSSLAAPSIAREIVSKVYEALKNEGFNVVKAPFGWYKEFELHCYGHPLSELSRTIRPAVEERRKAIEKKYYILTPSGDIYRPEDFKFDYGNIELKILVDKEVFRKEIEGGQGKVLQYLKKFGFEWEGLSDHGHMRYEPHATVILEAVMQYSWLIANSLNIPVFRVKGTNLFNVNAEAVKQHAELFGERMYEVRIDNDKYILRFAACYQQFSILKDWVLSYRDLPMGMFEIADSYRYEQRGELVLGFRLRRFHMPDLHILARDLEEAKSIAMMVRNKIVDEAKKLGREYQAIYNITEDFFNTNFEYIVELVKAEGKPVLVALYPSGLYYWVINVEYIIVDELKRPREIATWQIDVGNSRRFGIRYVDENGTERFPIIIHTAILGSVERYIYMVFDTVARNENENMPPTLPLWLSPIQVRIIPVSKETIPYAIDIAREFSRYGIRVDIDDRDESLGKKIRDAGIEWIPYVIVVGEREVKTGTVNVRIRKNGVQKVMHINEVIKLINEELDGYPRVESSLPMFLSKRPRLYYLQPIAQG